MKLTGALTTALTTALCTYGVLRVGGAMLTIETTSGGGGGG